MSAVVHGMRRPSRQSRRRVGNGSSSAYASSHSDQTPQTPVMRYRACVFPEHLQAHAPIGLRPPSSAPLVDAQRLLYLYHVGEIRHGDKQATIIIRPESKCLDVGMVSIASSDYGSVLQHIPVQLVIVGDAAHMRTASQQAIVEFFSSRVDVDHGTVADSPVEQMFMIPSVIGIVDDQQARPSLEAFSSHCAIIPFDGCSARPMQRARSSAHHLSH